MEILWRMWSFNYALKDLLDSERWQRKPIQTEGALSRHRGRRGGQGCKDQAGADKSVGKDWTVCWSQFFVCPSLHPFIPLPPSLQLSIRKPLFIKQGFSYGPCVQSCWLNKGRRQMNP